MLGLGLLQHSLDLGTHRFISLPNFWIFTLHTAHCCRKHLKSQVGEHAYDAWVAQHPAEMAVVMSRCDTVMQLFLSNRALGWIDLIQHLAQLQEFLIKCTSQHME